MVDEALLTKERPLRYLFLDLNAYFASVEQQEEPSLRGRPIAVCPVMADTSFVIAASYEAKAYGVKTGTRIGDARRMCPEIALVPARPPLYTAYHQKCLTAVETVLPIEEVCSIDEMRFRLLGEEREPPEARKLAHRMKDAIHEGVGEHMHCSVGVATNAFLSKVATDIEKPNGLVILEAKDLPGRLLDLKITDFAGINKRMAARLNAVGIFTSADLCSASKDLLHRGFGSIVGDRWWHLLRGEDVPPEKTDRKTLGHSHVLAPELRTTEGCHDILLRLIQKATARLRANQLCAGAVAFSVSGVQSWTAKTRLPETNDTLAVNEAFHRLWATRNFVRPRSVGVTFWDLVEAKTVNPSLFDEVREHDLLNQAVDKINQKFGKNTIYLASVEKTKNRASEKIAFNKTWLFSEGKDDNVWKD